MPNQFTSSQQIQTSQSFSCFLAFLRNSCLIRVAHLSTGTLRRRSSSRRPSQKACWISNFSSCGRSLGTISANRTESSRNCCTLSPGICLKWNLPNAKTSEHSRRTKASWDSAVIAACAACIPGDDLFLEGNINLAAAQCAIEQICYHRLRPGMARTCPNRQSTFSIFSYVSYRLIRTYQIEKKRKESRMPWCAKRLGMFLPPSDGEHVFVGIVASLELCKDQQRTTANSRQHCEEFCHREYGETMRRQVLLEKLFKGRRSHAVEGTLLILHRKAVQDCLILLSKYVNICVDGYCVLALRALQGSPSTPIKRRTVSW